MEVIKISNIKKTYNPKTIPVHALRGVDLSIEKGEFTAIMGPSGSGKTTLLQIAGLLSPADSGELMLQGSQFANLSERDRTLVRSQTLGTPRPLQAGAQIH